MRYLNTHGMPLPGFKDLLSEVLKTWQALLLSSFYFRFGFTLQVKLHVSMTFFKNFPFSFCALPFHNIFFVLGFCWILLHTAFCNTLTTIFQLGTLVGCLLVGWLVSWVVSGWVGWWVGWGKSNHTSTTSSKRLIFLSCWNRFEQMKSWQNFARVHNF